MSSGIYVVFWLLIIAAMSKAAKKKKEQDQVKAGGSQQRQPEQMPFVHKPAQQTPKPAGQQYQQAERPKTDGSTVTSTTDYLEKKARQDQLVHQEEKQEEQRRRSKETGGALEGERLIEGDLPAPGKIVVKCPYCCAENMIPANTRARYTCYFCRVELK